MLQKFFERPNEECTQWSHFLFIKLKKSSTSIFKKNIFYFASAENRPSGDLSDNLESSLPDKDFSAPKTIPQEAVFTSRPEHEAHAPKVITSQGSRSSTLSSMAQSKANMVSPQVLILKFLKICKPWWFIKDLPSYLVILNTFLA